MIRLALATSILPASPISRASPCHCRTHRKSSVLGERQLSPQHPGVVRNCKSHFLTAPSCPPHPTQRLLELPVHRQPPRRHASRARAPEGFRGLHKHAPEGQTPAWDRRLSSLPEFLDAEAPSSKQVYKGENHLWRDRSQLIWATTGAPGNEREPRGVDDRGGGRGPWSRGNYSLS